MKTCENCGSKVFSAGCVNCNEDNYIEIQNVENLKELKYKTKVYNRANAIWDFQKKFIYIKGDINEIKDRCYTHLQMLIIHGCHTQQETDFFRDVQKEIINIFKTIRENDNKRTS